MCLCLLAGMLGQCTSGPLDHDQVGRDPRSPALTACANLAAFPLLMSTIWPSRRGIVCRNALMIDFVPVIFRSIIQQGLASPLDSVFSSIDEVPMATASIAQASGEII